MIKTVLKYAETGVLLPIDPVFDPVVRHLWVTPEIYKMIYGQHTDSTTQEEWGTARARLEHIASGKMFAVGNKGKQCLMAPMWKPPAWDIWDVRAKNKRILGCFAEKDFFIGLHWEHRDVLGPKENWGHAIKKTRKKWDELFPGFIALKKEGEDEEYLSNINNLRRRS